MKYENRSMQLVGETDNYQGEDDEIELSDNETKRLAEIALLLKNRMMDLNESDVYTTYTEPHESGAVD